MEDDPALVLELAVLLVVVIAVLAWVAHACDGAAAAAVRVVDVDVERALGAATPTLMTYEQAVKLKRKTTTTTPAPGEQRCAMCLSEYGGAGELVRVLPACGHFFHPDCGVEKWLQKSGTCPVCRGELCPSPPLSSLPRPECPPRLGRR